MKMKMLLYALTLAVSTMAQSKPYIGGELFHKAAVRYGKFEARMMMASVSGTVSSMFLYYNDSYLGLPEPWREVDFEILGRTPDSVQTNFITGHSKAKVTSEKMYPIAASNTTWHTYTIIWTPDSVVLQIDGVNVRKDVGTQQVTDLQTKDMNLRFNLWASTAPKWVGEWNDAALPVYQYINWIQYSSYTPGQGAGGSDFTPVWKDDFNSLDEDKWGTANWTFTENRADFAPSNVVVQNGVLVLCLTKVGAPGFQGTIPVDPNGSSSLIQGAKPSISKPNLGNKDFQFNLLGQKL